MKIKKNEIFYIKKLQWLGIGRFGKKEVVKATRDFETKRVEELNIILTKDNHDIFHGTELYQHNKDVYYIKKI